MGIGVRLFFRHLFLLGFMLCSAGLAKIETIQGQLTSATSLGTSEIYAGGDPRAEILETTRERLNRALKFIQSGVGRESLCMPRACGTAADPALCHIVEKLSTQEQSACREFISRNTAQLLKINSAELTPFRLSEIPLHVADGKKLRSVVAITKKTPSGEIVFHHGSVIRLSSASLMALLTHELGHKVAPREMNEKFLDTVGAAVALYAPDYVAAAQAPPVIPQTVGFRPACAHAKDEVGKVLAGMVADLEGTSATATRMEGWRKTLEVAGLKQGWEAIARQLVATEAARAHRIREYFRKYLFREPTGDELAMMLSRMASGDSDEFIIASVAGDDEYLAARSLKGKESFLSAFYADFVGRAPEASEIADGIKQLERYDRGSWALTFLKKSPQAARLQIADWHKTLLNRQPVAAESDAYLQRIASGETWELGRARIVSSAEYLSLQARRWEACGNEGQRTATLPPLRNR